MISCRSAGVFTWLLFCLTSVAGRGIHAARSAPCGTAKISEVQRTHNCSSSACDVDVESEAYGSLHDTSTKAPGSGGQSASRTKGLSTVYSSRIFEIWAEALRNRKTDWHKPLFPLSFRDGLALLLACVALFVAAGGGIGGGGVLVPLFILVLQFPTNIAVALSNICIVGGAVSNFTFNIGRRHPFLPRPLIDWDLILVMEPATILGALVGGYLNKAFPNWITTCLLTCVLAFMAFKLVKRGVLAWQDESRQLYGSGQDEVAPLLQESEGLVEDEQQPSEARPVLIRSSIGLPVGSPNSYYQDSLHGSPMAYAHSHLTAATAATRWPSLQRTSAQPPASGASPDYAFLPAVEEDGMQSGEERADSNGAQGSGHQQQDTTRSDDKAEAKARQVTAAEAGVGQGDPMLEEHHAQQQQQGTASKLLRMAQVPVGRLSILIVMFLGVIVSDLGKAYLPCGSWQYWLVVLSIIPPILLVTAAVRVYLVRRNRQLQDDPDYQGYDGEVCWTEKATLVYPAICSLAGLIAGMFGVGGGIVKGPLMLEMGVLPDVASATSATMILFTASSASVVFLSFGGVQVDYAVASFLVGLVVTLAGQVVCWWLVQKLGRRSIIVFAMASLMLLALSIILYASILGVLSAIHERRLTDFGGICAHEG